MTTSKTNLCIYCPEIYEYFIDNRATAGGAERQLYLLSDFLSERLSVSFIVHDHGQQDVVHKADCALFAAHKPYSGTNPAIRFQQIRSIYNAMTRADPDVVLCRGDVLPPIIIQGLADRLEASFIYNLANDRDITVAYDSSNTITKNLFRKMLKNSTHIISQNSDQVQILENRFNQPSQMIPNGYPESETQKSPPGDYFLWVGRLEKDQKQPHIFLQLASRLKDEKFLLIGPDSTDPAYQNRLQSKINNLNNVSYVGPVSPDEIHEYYERATALVNTSKYEGFPNTFLEAWRKAVPVVSYRVDPNQFFDSCDSQRCANGDMETLVMLCNRLSKNPQLEEREGQMAHKQFLNHYTIEKVAQVYSLAVEQNSC